MQYEDLDESQKQAITRCCDIAQRIVPVTGQAGTGKTTIMRIVHAMLTQHGYRVVLCAPTGKAAKRIQEATGLLAMTIHRLLEYPRPGDRDEKTGKTLSTTTPRRDRNHPIDYDVVLADEYAMVNTEVHRNLIDALPRGGVLRAFGDVNQLPPIESFNKNQDKPSPFMEMLSRWNGIVLNQIHRQGEGSGIVSNGKLILEGRAPKRTDDFTLKITDYPVQEVRDYVQGGLEPYEFTAPNDPELDLSLTTNQIIVPTNKGKVGAVELNLVIQRLFKPNAPKEGVKLPRHRWDEKKEYYVVPGDKVIWTQNNYDLEVFNGETGIVKEITEYDEIIIDFGDRVLPIPPEVATVNKQGVAVMYDPRKDLDLAYVVTTHKAQGSEFDNVLYVLNKSSSFIQSRHNFYTAITRARKHVHLITDKFSLSYSTLHKSTRV